MGIFGCLIAVFTLLFGDNIYQQITGHSVFHDPISANSDMPTNTQTPNLVVIPSDTGEPPEYISVVGEYGALKWGPKDVSILMDEDTQIEQSVIRTYLKDFVLQVDVRNPFPISVGNWQYGISFRRNDPERADHFVLTISPEYWGLWNILEKKEDDIYIEGGTIDNLNLANGAINTITLLCQNDVGALYVNENFVTSLNLSGQENSGYITLMGPFFRDFNFPGYSIDFLNLRIWEIP